MASNLAVAKAECQSVRVWVHKKRGGSSCVEEFLRGTSSVPVAARHRCIQINSDIIIESHGVKVTCPMSNVHIYKIFRTPPPLSHQPIRCRPSTRILGLVVLMAERDQPSGPLLTRRLSMQSARCVPCCMHCCIRSIPHQPRLSALVKEDDRHPTPGPQKSRLH